MYDESLDYMYSIPIELDVKKPPSLGVDCIKLHSNRGMVGQAFNQNEILVADSEEELNKMLEPEEKNLEVLRLETLNNVIGIPIENENEDSVVGVLVLYNLKSSLPVEEQLEAVREEMDQCTDFLGQLISHNKKAQSESQTSIVQRAIINVSSECKLYLNSKLEVSMKSPSAISYFQYCEIGTYLLEMLEFAAPKLISMIRSQIKIDKQFYECQSFKLPTERIIQTNITLFRVTSLEKGGFLMIIQPLITIN